MHATRLAELAAVVASQSRLLTQQDVSAEHWGADQFWVLSRARVNEWARQLKSCQLLRPNTADFDPKEFWSSTQPLLEEVFLSEVCTRIWCATLAIIDELRFHGELDPIARSVFVANLEARRRALRLLLFARGLPGIPTTSLNLLRRDCEAWTDNLLAQFPSSRIAQQFCFEKRRVRTMARQTRQPTSAKRPAQLQVARSVSIRYQLATRATKPSVCPELNGEIGVTILSCLPATAFDGCGTPRATWGVDGFRSDMLSIDILEDLCATPMRPRFGTTGGLVDRP